MFSRQDLEEIEEHSLAPYGVCSKDSKGRANLDNEPDYRTVFQRDRDRVLHAKLYRHYRW
jgi:dGTPase